jgi:hypothetical protein
MNKITTINRATCRNLATEAKAALEAVASRYGLAVTQGNSRFDSDSVTIKATFNVVGESGAPKRFATDAAVLGLPPDCYGKVFVNRGTSYTITGIKLTRYKYPVSAKGPQGGQYKFPVDTVLRGLAEAA